MLRQEAQYVLQSSPMRTCMLEVLDQEEKSWWFQKKAGGLGVTSQVLACTTQGAHKHTPLAQ